MSIEESELNRIAGAALRFNKRGAFEQMVANHLVLSVNADHLHKITLIIEACYMSDTKKLEIDRNNIDKLYAVALSFLGTNYKTDFISMAWNFEENKQNFNHYIKEWFKPIPLTFSFLNDLERTRKQTRIDETKEEWQKFFLVTKRLNLTQSSFNMLKGSFLKWALPQVMEIFEKLSRTVDPTTYQEILTAFKGEKE